MKIYIASKFSEAARLRTWRDDHFPSRKLVSTSTWLEVAKTETSLGLSDAHRRNMALTDVADLVCADAVVLFNERHLHGGGRGGRHVELGMGIAWNLIFSTQALRGTNPLKLLLVVGERENVFHWHPYVTVVPDGDAALAYLDTYHRVVGCCEL